MQLLKINGLRPFWGTTPCGKMRPGDAMGWLTPL